MQGIHFAALGVELGEGRPVRLVVDPRSMDAGLFFWEDYGQRRLAGPVRFPLRRERDGPGPPTPGPGAAPDGASAPEPTRWAPAIMKMKSRPTTTRTGSMNWRFNASI